MENKNKLERIYNRGFKLGLAMGIIGMTLWTLPLMLILKS